MTNGDMRQRRRIPWRLIFWSIPVTLLLLPAVAMQFTNEVNWDVFDFIFATIMFGSVGLVLELTVRSSDNVAFRTAVGLAIAAAFLIIWINGAVGIIGDEDNPANLMFGAVLAVALLGSIAALFRAPGLAMAMFAAAIVQIAVGVIALASGMAEGPAAPYDVIGSTGFLTGMWLVSGLLFRKAARDQARVAQP
ncbi:MAG TPA: hypothetical protein VFO69_08775 [Allosphingosinicella sp.]|nr:hypothetical protein [Allosphingosinicella sp.]